MKVFNFTNINDVQEGMKVVCSYEYRTNFTAQIVIICGSICVAWDDGNGYDIIWSKLDFMKYFSSIAL